MKHLKILGLAAAAAGALVAFSGAGTASANVVCSSTTNPCPAASVWPNNTTVDFTLIGTATMKEVGPEGETIDTCTGGTKHGTMTQGTRSGGPRLPTFHLEKAGTTWTGCTFPTSTVAGGTLEAAQISGTNNGTVTGSGFEVTINTLFFGSCIYGTGEGLIVGKLTEGNPPILHTEVRAKKRSGSNVVCPSEAETNATYKLTSPSGTTGAITAN